ncbi:MAG: molybdopterin cofactor-binding domain-containing protein, partial [Pseudomonadota bacterium]
MDGPISTTEIVFTLNARQVSVAPEPGERLSESLRERLGARDVKIGCNAGDCGACTILLDGEPVCACLMTTQQASGLTVETVAGLVASDTDAQRLAESFQDHGAAQCGICTPGMMVSAVALLRQDSEPDEGAITDALGGVLCRCTGYRKIIDAIANVPGRVSADGGAGTAIRRLDGADKVSGAELFGDDVAPAGTFEVKVVRSPYPRAAFTFGDLDAWAEATDGIEAVLTSADIGGQNCFGVIPAFADQPVFAEEIARFRGEAVAAVVGTPEAIRRFKSQDFPVAWTELDNVTTASEAREPEAALLHEHRDTNLMCEGFVTSGDPELALADADETVEGEFTTGYVEHAYIEPEAGFAQMVNGRVEVHACTQSTAMDLEGLEIILGLNRSQIRVVPTGVGGGFGSKLDLSVQPYLALAAMKTGRPVRITYSRIESMQSTTKRHPSDITLKIGATKDGNISGFKFFGAFNTGAYASWGPTVANRVPVHASGPYRITDYRAESHGVHTNGPPAGAFRGFGVPQSAIAQESLFDELAEKLGRDALDFRLQNMLEDGIPTVCGQVFEQGVGAKACLEALRPAWRDEREKADAFNRSAAGATRRGVGLAAGWYGCGNTSLPNPSTIKAGVRRDGSVALHQGAMDIGQGANTVISQIFATALGVSASKLSLIGADTDVTPDAGKTSASRQTFVSGNAARLCGEVLRASILRHVNVSEAADLTFVDGCILVSDEGSEHEIDVSKMAADDEGYV